MKKMLTLLLALVMFLSMASLGAAEDGAVITKDVTINIRAMNQYTNLERILERYYELVAEDPNLKHVTLNFQYVTGADYRDKLTTAVVAQEELDLLFVGAWHGRTNFINDGVFKDLSAYFEDEANYPGLYTYYPEEFIDAQRINDGLYYVPLGAITEMPGVIYREDLRKEYGCDPITDETTLMAYLQTIQSHIDDGSLDMNYAWGISGQGFMSFRTMEYEAPQNDIFKLNAGTDFYIYVNDENQVVNAVVAGDDASQFAGFPEGYTDDFIAANFADLTNWVKYCNNYAIDGEDYIDFNMGLSAVTYHCLSEIGAAKEALLQVAPEAEVGFYVFDETLRNREPGAIATTFAANNSVAVPAWSSDEKTDAVMCFLDALYGRKEINDLFSYGIQGEDWDTTDGEVKETLRTSEDPNHYFFPVYSLIYTPGEFNYYPDWIAADENLKAYYDYQYNTEESYLVTKLAGFAFDPTPVESEIAAISGVAQGYMFNYGTYVTEEATLEKIAEQHELFVQAGLDNVRQEIISQFQAFLDSKAE